jgi:hypothetical protein
MYGTVSNVPSTIHQSTDAASRTPSHKLQGATVESILHKLWIALSEKR